MSKNVQNIVEKYPGPLQPCPYGKVSARFLSWRRQRCVIYGLVSLVFNLKTNKKIWFGSNRFNVSFWFDSRHSVQLVEASSFDGFVIGFTIEVHRVLEGNAVAVVTATPMFVDLGIILSLMVFRQAMPTMTRHGLETSAQGLYLCDLWRVIA